MAIICWDYYGESNSLIYRITEVEQFLVSYRLKRNLKQILNFTNNTKKILDSILERDAQQKLKMEVIQKTL